MNRVPFNSKLIFQRKILKLSSAFYLRLPFKLSNSIEYGERFWKRWTEVFGLSNCLHLLINSTRYWTDLSSSLPLFFPLSFPVFLLYPNFTLSSLSLPSSSFSFCPAIPTRKIPASSFLTSLHYAFYSV